MVTDTREPSRDYPIPSADNTIAEDMARLILALSAIGIDVAGLLAAVAGKAAAIHSHQLAEVVGLIAALNAKAAADHVHALGGLSDVDTAGATTYQVLARALDGKWRPWTIDLVNVLGAAAYARLDGAAFTGETWVPTVSTASDTLNVVNVTTLRAAIAALVASALGNDPAFAATMTAALAAKAPLASPALTGNPTATTQSAKNSSTRLATTAFVQGEKGYSRGDTTLTASTTLTSSHFGNIISCAASAAITVTLPAAATYARALVMLVNTGSAPVTVAGSIVADGSAVAGIDLPTGGSVTLTSNATSWVVVHRTLPPVPLDAWLAGISAVIGPISPAQLAAAVAALAPAQPAIGVGQTWQAVSRTPGVSYQNTTNRPIEVCVGGLNSGSGSSLLEVSSNNSAWVIPSAMANGRYMFISMIIPPTHYYRIPADISASNISVKELRT